MSMRNPEKRLEKLEQEYKPPEVIVFLVTDFSQGELKGWKGDGFYIARNPGETEEECADRAHPEAKAYGEAHRSLLMPGGVLMIHMDREDIPYVKQEPVPEAVVTAQSTVKPKQPLSGPPPKPQPPRIVTIKEVEGQYTDHQHWMS
jgi:hypothetical protein